MKAVDLLSSGKSPHGVPPAILSLVAAAAVLLVGISAMALVYSRAEKRSSSNDAQLSSLHRELAQAEAAQELQATASPGADVESGLQSVVVATLDRRAEWGGLLRGVGRVVPPGAWLTKLSVGEPGSSVEGGEVAPTPAAAPASEGATAGQPPAGASTPASSTVTLSVAGCALNQGLVGRVVSGLGRLPGASEVSVSSKQAGQGSACGGHPGFQLSFTVSGSAL